jgi:hypothetical protein
MLRANCRVKPCVATAESIELKPDPIPLSREQESESGKSKKDRNGEERGRECVRETSDSFPLI